MQVDLLKMQNLLDWIKTKIFLDTISSNSIKRLVKRGEVYLCNFGIGIGSEIQKERPCIIVQNNNQNFHSGNILVVPISHTNKNLSCILPINTRRDIDNNIILDGYANVSNLMCVSKARLSSYIATLSKEEMKNIDFALFSILNLSEYYNQLQRQLKDRNIYISKLKKQIEELKSITNTKNFNDLKQEILKKI